MVKKMGIKESVEDRIFLGFVFLISVLIIAVTLYPMIYTISSSISDPYYVVMHQVVFLPKGFSLEAFRFVLNNSEIYTYFFNSVLYAVCAMLLNTFLTMLMAYPLSRRNFVFRKQVMIIITVTMFFGGGMIPNFLLIRNLGLYNTRLAMILPAAITTYNVIIARSFIENNIHESLIESAYIDGANDFRILFSIVFPLAKSIVAVILLFVAVDRWNSYMDALMYLKDQSLAPIQIYLRRVLLLVSSESGSNSASESLSAISLVNFQIKYAVVIVTMAPIMCIYPFVQKYFAKGVSLGAVKG
jgi:putative aldouronate transport system permease protein